MNKSEFLNILGQSLSGEVAPEILEKNINYYAGYISAQTVEEEQRMIEELGDPRLIAKSIIEADKAAKEKGKGNWSGSNYQDNTSEEEQEDNTSGYSRSIFLSKMKWYHKLIAVAVVIILFVVIALIGRLLLGFLFAFGLPILLLLLVMSLFRRR